jgi:hypothetical protein
MCLIIKILRKKLFPRPCESEMDELLNDNVSGNENNNEEIQVEKSDEDGTEAMEPRKSTQIYHPSTKLHDYVIYNISFKILSYQNYTLEYKVFLTLISKKIEPNNYQEAITTSI